jgi:MOSC domain-containing protein YiiM
VTRIKAKIVAVSAGGNEDLSKDVFEQIEVDFEGIVGDHHAGASREAYSGDREPKGTQLRNDRQWSGVSVEELQQMSEQLALSEPLTASTLGANLCLQGIADFSLLPRGTRLKFPSGAALIVEEYNPPCLYMSIEVSKKHATRTGVPLKKGQWQKSAAGRRGVVGVVDVPGVIRAGDEVDVSVFEAPEITRY